MSQIPLNGVPSTHEEGRFKHAAVAADSPESSEVGTSIMKDEGGSAVDAAIAAVLCSGVVNAHSCGIGGGAIITYYKRSTGKVYTIIGREQAPAALQPDVFIDDPISKRLGGLSICTPGEILCLYEAWKLGGRLPWKQLFQPAIDLCKKGVTVRTALANAIDEIVKNDKLCLKEKVPDFIHFLTNPETGEIYKKGDMMYRPALAKTLETIANDGPDCFYKGNLTDDIIADIREKNGIISKEDLANYTAPIKPPISLKLNDDLTIYSPPLPTSGVLYQYMLDLLKDFKFDGLSVSTVEKSITTWHRVTEAFKHSAAIKQQLGDNDICTEVIKMSIDEILKKTRNEDYVKDTRARIIDTKTFDAAYYASLNTVKQPEDHGTSHLSVLGPDGDAVSVTHTVSLYFGSKVVGTRTGIVFNDVLRNFSLPNVEGRYDCPPLNSNLAEPLRRPLTAMSPSIVVDKNGDVKLVIGASGATRIPTSMALVTMETLWFNWGIKEAIDYPRIHHQLYPPKICCQPGLPKELINGLQEIGHAVTNINSISVVQGILRTGDEITAYSDYRKEGKASGF
ncbi:glutathione hydrolase 1 proenzyme-like isoform X2 [Mercenaria mercenaria]|uniref:glutathione hydrolase 1 proenzyme-like isoform X2 n=1 Tax=Mercenaria mercenaria TaxID=6596 RepID=UPI00234E8E89|nr:glutathione hydrolase 1 proenzyme-like isoform X2 [Mercenaria mercenaria]